MEAGLGLRVILPVWASGTSAPRRSRSGVARRGLGGLCLASDQFVCGQEPELRPAAVSDAFVDGGCRALPVAVAEVADLVSLRVQGTSSGGSGIAGHP